MYAILLRARSSMDRASDCGSEGCEFESHRAHTGRVGRVVHGDGFENRSPAREAQVRLLYPPLSPAKAQGAIRVTADKVRRNIDLTKFLEKS